MKLVLNESKYLEHLFVEGGEEPHGLVLKVDVPVEEVSLELKEVLPEEEGVPLVKDSVSAGEDVMKLALRVRDQLLHESCGKISY